ncbi:MAG: hypothetical protein CALGDGBN_02707 [Pseudomonadales bacterium]|nr:hypothetical protein [Pseudomonadales bacterium]
MNLRARLGLGALIVALPSLACGGAIERLSGVARQPDGGAVAYREIHEIDGDTHRIEYLGADGTAIARKWLDYRCSDSAPAFEQLDLRDGSRLGARWEDGTYVLLRDDASRAVHTRAPLVGSSGFDRFVREHHARLAAGERIAFDFALPARLQTLRLLIERTEPARELPGAQLWLRIVPAQSLLRAFVAPIVLAYDATPRLLYYRGLSNLADARGRSLQVEILYDASAPEMPNVAISTPSARAAAMPAAPTEPPAGPARIPAHFACQDVNA